MNFIREPQGLLTPTLAGALTSLSLAHWTLTIYPLTRCPRRGGACCTLAPATSRSDFPALSVCLLWHPPPLEVWHPWWGPSGSFPSLQQPFLSYAAWGTKDNQVLPQSISQVDKLKLVTKTVNRKMEDCFQRLFFFKVKIKVDLKIVLIQQI